MAEKRTSQAPSRPDRDDGNQAPPGKGKTPRAGTGAPRKIAAALSRKPTAKMAREMLAVELRRLRAMFVEISGRYTANTEARIAELIGTAENGKVPAAKISDLLQAIRDINVKPQKGRRKDLARIEKAVKAAESALGE